MRLPSAKPSPEWKTEHTQHAARLADNVLHRFTTVARSLSLRDSSNSDSGTCQPGDNSPRCETPASETSSQNIAIVLGVVIPLSCAVIVLIFLHRRHLKKQRMEDINDPHKSLDFGLEGAEPVVANGRRNRKGPEMRATEMGGPSSRKHHGLSMDMGMDIGSPYILPAGLNGSHESLHSMSRGLRDEHDPYRPVTQFPRPSYDNESLKFGRLNDDKGSLRSMSTGHHSALQEKSGLVANARPMSQSYGKRMELISPTESSSSTDHSRFEKDTGLLQENSNSAEGKTLPSPPPPPILLEPEPSDNLPPPRTSSKATGASPHPPRKDSISSLQSAGQRPESSNYGDEEPRGPAVHVTMDESEPYDIDTAHIYTRYSVDEPEPAPEPMPALHAPVPVSGSRLSVMGMRPLPPDVPDDNPEIRANRIRSFYKEYFDDTKPNPGNGQYDEYDYMDGVIYDPDTGGFFAPNKPFAHDPGRRAMTPPPRSRPRVSGNSHGGPHIRQHSTMSAGRPRGRSLPKKKLPPPKALTDLPTPYLMRDDSAIFNAADFAPPTTFRNMQNGSRPGSPMGLQRPYSPSVKAFTPLASSFEHLAALPSPHDLRKSGTFTALDFAPPSKIRDPGLSPNDAGSIRSNRSGMSAMSKNAVREGAYRVSRIPKELVTSRDDLAMQLRPKMNLTSAA